jgi:hypothetical protein
MPTSNFSSLPQEDPHGKNPHETGAKLDSNKEPWDLLMDFHPNCNNAPKYDVHMSDHVRWVMISRLKDSTPLDLTLVMMFLPFRVFEVAQYGAKKYTKGGWLSVADGIKRYRAAAVRHLRSMNRGETVDVESGEEHQSHVAWNIWAVYTLEQNARKGSA